MEVLVGDLALLINELMLYSEYANTHGPVREVIASE